MASYSGQEIDLRDCVQYVIDVLNNDELDADRVDIRLSDDIKRSVKKVHPGVGGSYEIRRREYNREEPCEPFSRDALKEVSSVMLGEFRPSAARNGGKIGTIRIYPNAIAEFCEANGLDPDTVLLATLAREAFRACHYSVFKSGGVSKRWDSGSTKKNRDIVKESLADAFEYIFLINKSGSGEWLNLAEAHKYMDYLENTWRSCDIEDWPSSGALGIGGVGLTKVAVPPNIMDRLLHGFLHDWKSAADIIYTVSNIGFPLDQWIDTSTGEYDKYSVRELLRDLSDCVEDILRMTLGFEKPVFINNGLFPEKLNIKLSEDILYESYGASLKDIRKMLDDIIKDIPDKRLIVLKEMLYKINGIKELEINSEIRRYINDIHPENEKIRKLLGQIENKQSLFLGKFIPSKDTDKLGNIILYPKAIAISKRTKASSFDTVFWATFAHEIFHAYHYGAFVQNGKTDRWNDSLNRSESKIVKESLAAAFESKFVLQCESDGIIPRDLSKGLRRELEYEWLDNDLLDWPYSGALDIIREELPAFDFPLFTKLTECSLEGWELPTEAIMAGYYTLKVENKTGKI